MVAGALEEGFDPFREVRVVGVGVYDDLADFAVLVPGEDRVAADQIGLGSEVGPTDPVPVLHFQDYCFHQPRVLLHLPVGARRFLRPRKRHRFKPESK